jgi:Zn-dependent oligopeptidase
VSIISLASGFHCSPFDKLLFTDFPGEAKSRFNAIAEQLAQLSTAFTNNVLDATKAFSLLLTSPEQVAGLPSSALGMFAQAAKAKGHPEACAATGPWLVTLDAPSYMPIMQHARDRSASLRLPFLISVMNCHMWTVLQADS